jgi:hypothetical protein
MTPVVIENRFNVPPDYAAKWLTDMRPDDQSRWFDGPTGVTVTKKGNQIYTEGPHPMGWAKGTVTIDSPTSWHAETDFFKTKGGPMVMRGGVRESVRAEGQGTLHRAELTVEPLGFGMKLMYGLMGKGMMMKSLTKGFARMKQEMEAQYKAGKPPTA